MRRITRRTIILNITCDVLVLSVEFMQSSGNTEITEKMGIVDTSTEKILKHNKSERQKFLMFAWLEIAVGACLYYSGLVKLAQMWTQKSGQKLVILCHHSASGGHLRSQFLYLKRHYRILHLEAALEELYGISKNAKRDRRTLLVAAFDDGYNDNYTDAFAIACELQIPITIFLVPQNIESGQPFTWVAGEYHHLVPYAQVDEATIEGRTYRLRNPAERVKLTQVIDDHARYP